MSYLINTIACDIFIPLDIDEFIVYYDKHTNKISTNNLISYLENLKIKYNSYDIFKMNYIIPIKTNKGDNIYQFTQGKIKDYKEYAKTFIKPEYKKQYIIDHGNHMVKYTKYIVSDMYLVHYHDRNKKQLLEKIKNNIIGLGYPINEIAILENLLNLQNNHSINGEWANNTVSIPGWHHIKDYINYYKYDKEYNNSIQTDIYNSINISEILDYLTNLYSIKNKCSVKNNNLILKIKNNIHYLKEMNRVYFYNYNLYELSYLELTKILKKTENELASAYNKKQ